MTTFIFEGEKGGVSDRTQYNNTLVANQQ